MFFFIAGIQPKRITVEQRPRICGVCGLQRAYLKRVDSYISLFFIPLIPIKRGEQFLECENCGSVSDESGNPMGHFEKEIRCPRCGSPVKKGFKYCPSCGSQL
jgi:uncharacterized paraquat-inducible protein A